MDMRTGKGQQAASLCLKGSDSHSLTALHRSIEVRNNVATQANSGSLTNINARSSAKNFNEQLVVDMPMQPRLTQQKPSLNKTSEKASAEPLPELDKMS